MTPEREEYWFVGMWENPRDGKEREVVMPVKASQLDDFLHNIAPHHDRTVVVRDRLEGGTIKAAAELIRWLRIETHTGD